MDKTHKLIMGNLLISFRILMPTYKLYTKHNEQFSTILNVYK